MTHEGHGTNVEWYTPPWLFAAMGIPFDLDPCHPRERLPWIPARNVLTEVEDGLAQPWAGRCWVNPPYGPATDSWLSKLAAHRNGIALVFARSDTAWFHKAAASADAVLFLRGRIRFVNRAGKDGTQTPAGSMLLAWGLDNAAVLDRLALHGHGLCARFPRPSAASQPTLQLGAAA